LAEAKVGLVLYPPSAFRAMVRCLRVFRAIKDEGTQQGVLDSLQSRAELYDFLGYLDYERMLDELIPKEGKP
jgi:methylisocitrate lyase